MGDRTRKSCRRCGKRESEVGPISWGGNCSDCGQQELASNVIQMYARTGPNFDRWRRSMAACVGGTILDDVSERT